MASTKLNKRYTTRSARRRASKADFASKLMRIFLHCYAQGNKERCIRLLNDIPPIYIVKRWANRELTHEESAYYLEAIKNVPESWQEIMRMAHIFQDVKQTCRKYLPGTDSEIIGHGSILSFFTLLVNKAEAKSKE